MNPILRSAHPRNPLRDHPAIVFLAEASTLKGFATSVREDPQVKDVFEVKGLRDGVSPVRVIVYLAQEDFETVEEIYLLSATERKVLCFIDSMRYGTDRAEIASYIRNGPRTVKALAVLKREGLAEDAGLGWTLTTLGRRAAAGDR